MPEAPDTGGEPTHLVACTACGEVYPAQVETDQELRPIGVESGCACGNTEFTPLPD